MNGVDFEHFVQRVARDRASSGALDASFLDGVGVLLGRGALVSLVGSLQPLQPLPGLLGGLLEELRAETRPRVVVRAVASLASTEESLLVAEHLGRARRALDRLRGRPVEWDEEVAEEVEAILSDLVEGRGVI